MENGYFNNGNFREYSYFGEGEFCSLETGIPGGPDRDHKISLTRQRRAKKIYLLTVLFIYGRGRPWCECFVFLSKCSLLLIEVDSREMDGEIGMTATESPMETASPRDVDVDVDASSEVLIMKIVECSVYRSLSGHPKRRGQRARRFKSPLTRIKGRAAPTPYAITTTADHCLCVLHWNSFTNAHYTICPMYVCHSHPWA